MRFSHGITPPRCDRGTAYLDRRATGNGFLDWASASDMASSGMTDVELEAYWSERAWEMSEVGINLNFAPVVDLDINPKNPIIGALGRSYGRSPAVVARMAEMALLHRSGLVGVSPCIWTWSRLAY